MGELIRAKQPCPCGRSSDAYEIYTDGSYCYSCNKSFRNKGSADHLRETPDGNITYVYREWRGVTAETMKHFGVLTKCIDDKPWSICFPTILNGKIPVAGQVREIDEKNFVTFGDNPEGILFGELAFPPGSSDSITICEGAMDAMSSYQITGRPAVAIPGASTARKYTARRFNYLNSFDKIRLSIDADDPGSKAKAAIAGNFDFEKILDVSMDARLKDCNQYLQEGRSEEYKRLWWNARRFMPAEIISSMEEFKAAIEEDQFQRPLAEFPWAVLQGMLQGLRPGEITLLTAPEGIGKTEIVRAIEHHVLKTTDCNLGVVHLEEGKVRTLKGLAGLTLGEPVHLPDSGISDEAILEGLRKLIRRDDRLYVYSNFGGDDPDQICDLIRFLVVSLGCQIITLDHITMLATGRDDEDERKFLDRLSTKLGKMVNELGFHLVLVSHVNDDGKTRGSRNISKIADNRVDLYRDLVHPDENVRNTVSLTVSKARFTSNTGPAGQLFFDRETFSLKEKQELDAHGQELPH